MAAAFQHWMRLQRIHNKVPNQEIVSISIIQLIVQYLGLTAEEHLGLYTKATQIQKNAHTKVLSLHKIICAGGRRGQNGGGAARLCMQRSVRSTMHNDAMCYVLYRQTRKRVVC